MSAPRIARSGPRTVRSEHRTRRAPAMGRRIVGVILVSAAMAVAVPATLGAALFAFLIRPWRPRTGRLYRVAAIATVYCGTEISGLAGAVWRWFRFVLDRDAVRERRSRVRSLDKALSRVRAATERFGGLDVRLVGGPDAQQETGPPELPAGPLIVCGRHGGVGGAFLLASILLSDCGRLPRVVLKQALSWDPLIDALLSRIPHAFVDPQPGDAGETAARIGALAEGMTAGDALLIFPEGGNFSPSRRIRAIRRLRHRGLTEAAARAEQLHHVMPPHPDGLFAAVDAAPEADAVFVAHTGLDHLQNARALWRGIPLRAPVVLTWWVVPAARIPRSAAARVAWLEDQWSRMDDWVAEHRGRR